MVTHCWSWRASYRTDPEKKKKHTKKKNTELILDLRITSDSPADAHWRGVELCLPQQFIFIDSHMLKMLAHHLMDYTGL